MVLANYYGLYPENLPLANFHTLIDGKSLFSLTIKALESLR
jgi:hypothetical protein